MSAPFERLREIEAEADAWRLYDDIVREAPPGRTPQEAFNVFMLSAVVELESKQHRPLLPPKIIAAATLVGTAAASFVTALFGRVVA